MQNINYSKQSAGLETYAAQSGSWILLGNCWYV